MGDIFKPFKQFEDAWSNWIKLIYNIDHGFDLMLCHISAIPLVFVNQMNNLWNLMQYIN